jgi:hypothetical protein
MQHDLFRILHNDHETTLSILSRLGDSPPDRQALFDELYRGLNAHTKGEEYAFYNQLSDRRETELFVKQALSQHRDIGNILTQMRSASLSSPEWPALLREAKNRVEEHVRMEEEYLFPAAMKLLSNQHLTTITAAFLSEKQQALMSSPAYRI